MEGYYVIFFTVENAELRHQNDIFGSLDVVLVREDAFIIRVSDVGHDLDGWAAYEDIPQEFLSDESSALKETLINVIKKGAIGSWSIPIHWVSHLSRLFRPPDECMFLLHV